MTTPNELNKILFDQLHSIRNAQPIDLKDEIDRAEAVALLAEQVVMNNKTIVEYTRIAVQGGATFVDKPIPVGFLGVQVYRRGGGLLKVYLLYEP